LSERVERPLDLALRPLARRALARAPPVIQPEIMRARWIVAGMGTGLVLLALVLEHIPVDEVPLVALAVACEPFHLVAHAILYGSLAAALAAWWFPASTLDAPRPQLRGRALVAALVFALIAGTQELCQALARARAPAREELFDLTVDVAGATLGLIAWTAFDRRRRYFVARSLGALLHPVLIGPVGVFALTWSRLRSTRAALLWTALAVLAVAPVAAVWLVGLHRGSFSDRDLSIRAERPRFLAMALVAAMTLAGIAHGLDAPRVVLELTLAGAVAAALLTLTTIAGLKVSGHVAVPVAVVVMLQASSSRGPYPFLLMAVAVSWARVREGRHTAREVLAGWGVAGATGIFTRLVA
jgi:hypothetical protein